MALQFLFRLYIQFSSKGDSSGIIGAVLLLLLWLYASGLVLLLAAVVNAVLLGEGEPAPRTGSEDADEGDAHDERVETLRDRLHRERARRQTLEHEHDRIARELERAESNADEGLSALRQRNRALRRWLAWKERPLPVRLVGRLLGAAPPEPDLRPTGSGIGSVPARSSDGESAPSTD
jgi:membrane protein